MLAESYVAFVLAMLAVWKNPTESQKHGLILCLCLAGAGLPIGALVSAVGLFRFKAKIREDPGFPQRLWYQSTQRERFQSHFTTLRQSGCWFRKALSFRTGANRPKRSVCVAAPTQLLLLCVEPVYKYRLRLSEQMNLLIRNDTIAQSKRQSLGR
jgi:hypothetical protein